MGGRLWWGWVRWWEVWRGNGSKRWWGGFWFGKEGGMWEVGLKGRRRWWFWGLILWWGRWWGVKWGRGGEKIGGCGWLKGWGGGGWI